MCYYSIPFILWMIRKIFKLLEISVCVAQAQECMQHVTFWTHIWGHKYKNLFLNHKSFQDFIFGKIDCYGSLDHRFSQLVVNWLQLALYHTFGIDASMTMTASDSCPCCVKNCNSLRSNKFLTVILVFSPHFVHKKTSFQHLSQAPLSAWILEQKIVSFNKPAEW